LPPLGFRIATFLFVLALQVTLEWPRGTKKWALAVVVAFATSLICYYVFQDYLSVLLPRGTWSEM
jgi:putative tricarboxylic transport membrane protein